MNTHIISFHGKIRKIFIWLSLSTAMLSNDMFQWLVEWHSMLAEQCRLLILLKKQSEPGLHHFLRHLSVLISRRNIVSMQKNIKEIN